MVDESFDSFFASVGVGISIATVLVSILKLLTYYYFYFILLFLCMVLVVLLVLRKPFSRKRQGIQEFVCNNNINCDDEVFSSSLIPSDDTSTRKRKIGHRCKRSLRTLNQSFKRIKQISFDQPKDLERASRIEEHTRVPHNSNSWDTDGQKSE